MARPWIDYLARCSAMLSAGRPAVDIAVFVGEEAPVTGLFERRVRPTVPAGFDFDYIGPDALADILRVEDGDRSSSEGASYRLLYLGGSIAAHDARRARAHRATRGCRSHGGRHPARVLALARR